MRRLRSSVYLRLLLQVRPYLGRVGLALVCMFLASACNVAPPWLLKNVVDDVLIAKNTLLLNVLSLGIVVLFLIKGIAGYGHQYLMSWIGQRVVMDIRLKLYEHMQSLSFRYFHASRVGELLSRVTNDVNVLQSLVTTVLVDLVIQAVSFVAILGFLFYLNWRLTLVTFAVLPLAGWVIDLAARKLRRVGHEIQEQLARLSAIAEEALSSIRIVRIFATEEEELGRFSEQNRANFRSLMRGTQVHAALSGTVEVILIVALALILWLGGRDVIGGRLTPGELIAFLGYLVLLVQPIRVVSRVVSQVQQGLAAADRIFDVMSKRGEVLPPKHPVVLDSLKGEILFENVWFAYEGERWVLRQVNFHVASGETVALVGTTGAGKSTVADLIPRLYDPQKGRISIDGHDVRRLDLSTLRRHIGVVPQDSLLLKGSLAFNVAYGCPEATEDEVRRALDEAGLSDFLATLPEGLETEIGERGVTLSGGQRQRVAIARALVRNPRILIMDEATSSLDAAVEQQIQEAMQRAARGRTSLIIAHRLSTIRQADRIIVIEGGAVVEEGSHDDLIALQGRYCRLYSLQFGLDDGTSHR
ncbi:MAG: ABC transporter ATP-binding protein [Synergistales bacterium]|jgi:subfamily B ATP-binding cassette protein MsbA|nr:ABC transporter ATP-binding protein [Synergistales bacterium]